MQTTCIYVGKQTCVMYRKKQEKNENHVRMKLHNPKHSQIKTNKMQQTYVEAVFSRNCVSLCTTFRVIKKSKTMEFCGPP